MKDIIHSCQDFAALATFEGGGLRRSSFGSDGKASGFPGLDAAVQHAHVLVAEEFEDNSGMRAARGLWFLEFFGHQNVRLLDGGIKRRKGEGFAHPTKADSPNNA